MTGTDDKYFECPECGMMMKFQYDIDLGMYISKCPCCGSLLEIDKKEYEDDSDDYEEGYFEKEF